MKERLLFGHRTGKKSISEGEDFLSRELCLGLGGRENIFKVSSCVTRLRCEVHNLELVDDDRLKATEGALGIIHRGSCVQVIYGPKVSHIRENLKRYLADEQTDAGRE